MRSLLFIPADDEKKLAKGVGSGADALILDLEDAVSAAAQGAARARSPRSTSPPRARSTSGPCSTCASMRSTRPTGRTDLAGVMGSRPDGILLPKARSGDDVHKLSIALHHAEERAGADKGATRIIAIITEVPVSLLAARTPTSAPARGSEA